MRTDIPRLTLEQLRATIEAGGIQGITLRGEGGGFYVEAETRRGSAAILITKRQQPRRFRNANRALAVLRELGIREARIDTSHWNPEQAELERPSRPDRRDALRLAHGAAAQLAGIRASMDDPRPSVPHDEVKARWVKQRAELLGKADK